MSFANSHLSLEIHTAEAQSGKDAVKNWQGNQLRVCSRDFVV